MEELEEEFSMVPEWEIQAAVREFREEFFHYLETQERSFEIGHFTEWFKLNQFNDACIATVLGLPLEEAILLSRLDTPASDVMELVKDKIYAVSDLRAPEEVKEFANEAVKKNAVQFFGHLGMDTIGREVEVFAGLPEADQQELLNASANIALTGSFLIMATGRHIEVAIEGIALAMRHANKENTFPGLVGMTLMKALERS